MKKLLLILAFIATSSLVAADGAALFKKCIVCHGAKAEKKALNKSQVIAGWKSEQIVEALKGYKAGTYGGPLKGTMKGQVIKLSDDDMKTVADHIVSLQK